MRNNIHPRLGTWFEIAEILELAARELAREARKRVDSRKPRSRRGATLRPSIKTPLWNALVPMVKRQLRHRGDRAILARELDLHRARVGEYFDTQSAMPDAERTLQLLIWLARRAGSTEAKSNTS
jgi:uncharacterized damage-inducible protein DinB